MRYEYRKEDTLVVDQRTNPDRSCIIYARVSADYTDEDGLGIDVRIHDDHFVLHHSYLTFRYDNLTNAEVDVLLTDLNHWNKYLKVKGSTSHARDVQSYELLELIIVSGNRQEYYPLKGRRMRPMLSGGVA